MSEANDVPTNDSFDENQTAVKSLKKLKILVRTFQDQITYLEHITGPTWPAINAFWQLIPRKVKDKKKIMNETSEIFKTNDQA